MAHFYDSDRRSMAQLSLGVRQHARSAEEERLWDRFINTPLRDARNSPNSTILKAPNGRPYPARTDVHDSTAMSGHIRQLATYFGAISVGILGLDAEPYRTAAADSLSDEQGGDKEVFPFAIVCAIPFKHDPTVAKGVGGQMAVQRGGIVSFSLAAYIRELGYRAVRAPSCPAALVQGAGLGSLAADERIITRKNGSKAYAADLVLTDLPLVESLSSA